MNIDREFRCRHFRGDKPCSYCQGKMCEPLRGKDAVCGHFEEIGANILIIKLGALGDVLRTTSLLPAIRLAFPASAVTWITQPAAMPLLEGSGLQRVLPWSVDNCCWAENTQWDLVICLDKEEGPTTLAGRVSAKKRYGFGRNSSGFLMPLADSCSELFQLGIDDELKFQRNMKTYPRLIAEACELPWGPNPYCLVLSEEELVWARKVFAERGKGLLIGLNVGAGEVFAGKQWPWGRFLDLALELAKWGFTPVFLGGSREKELYGKLRERVQGQALFPGCEFTLRQFAALVSQLKVMVSGDSLAMHLALALGVHAVTLFGSTTEREIEFYGHGEAIIGRVPCSPCYLRDCPRGEICMSEISVENVFNAIQRGLKTW